MSSAVFLKTSVPAVVEMYGGRLGEDVIAHMAHYTPTISDMLTSYGSRCRTLCHGSFDPEFRRLPRAR